MDPHVELRELLISNYEDYGGRLGLNIPWDLNLPVFPCTNSSCILEYRERRLFFYLYVSNNHTVQ